MKFSGRKESKEKRTRINIQQSNRRSKRLKRSAILPHNHVQARLRDRVRVAEERNVLGHVQRRELGREEERLLAGALLEEGDECAEGGDGCDGVDSELLLEDLQVVTASIEDRN